MTQHLVTGTAPEGSLDDRVDETLTEALKSVLGRAGADDDALFSDLGGDSLRAVRVLAACWRSLGVELPLRSLTPATRLGDFRRTLREASAEAARIPRQPRGTELPLSPGQEGLYALYRADPANAAYNVPLTLRLDSARSLDGADRPDGGPAETRIRTALEQLARRHTALRTVFTERDGRAVAAVRERPDPDWHIEDLSGLPPEEREERAEALVREVSVAPLDLARSPVRATLIRLTDDSVLLVLVLHHLVCDAWSLRVLVDDLLGLYGGGDPTGDGTESPLGAVDAAAWERGRLTDERRERLADFWRQRLDGVPEVLELPADRPRPAVRTFRGARIPVRVPRTVVGALTSYARERGVTLFTALAAGCALTLRRYTGQDDIVLGFPVAGRVRPELDQVVGYLTKTVPLRIRLEDRPGTGTLLTRLHEDIAAAQDHAELPLDAIADAAGVRRAPGVPPLVQCALVLFADGREAVPPPGLRARLMDPGTGTSKFDLNWYLEERDGELAGYVEFSTDLFDAATAERLHGHFVASLRALAAADPRQPATRLPMLTAEEQTALLGGAAPRREDGAADGGAEGEADWLPVHRMVEREAAARPDHQALWHAGGGVTYGELNARADALAAALAARGLGPEDLVGVHIGRSPEQMAALLAVLKTGAAYLPLDPAYPAERLAYMARDARLSAVLTRGEAPAFAVAAQVPEIIDVGAVPDTAPGPDAGAGPDTGPDQLAYVIYTSGTTGRPKGVQITHRALANVITASRTDFGIGPEDRVLQVVSFNFDASVWEIFMALACGATLCLGPPDVARAEESIESVIRACGATLMYLPPALLSLVDPAAVPGVRLALTGGDLIPAELRRRWTDRCRFFVAYGPTEGTIVQTWQEHTADLSATLPIGRPFDGVRLYVLDAELDPVPVGAVGEVYVGGLAVSRGYRDRPGLTAGAYLPDPYAGRPGARMYRTGDRVRRLPGGELTFVGRTDHQIKVRGYRIEPAEVEAALLKCPGVEAAAVVAEPGPGGRSRLVAYAVTPPDRPDLLGGVRDALRDTLPDHMVPTRIHRVPTVPLTVNGKVDRAALPALADVDDDALSRLLDQVEGLTPEDGRATA
ncbi:amino acid adenylation domain-containing protein [Streptomyces sp. NEAU-S77]|uniref:non-ribosomal peptide synthetase n=1 Tax=Streptomyces sp. NEAU-S77 TaxID=3411033 RepID=UPI003BA28E35